MKKLYFLLLIILCAAVVSAANVTVQENSVDNVVIKEVDNPAIYDLIIKNNGRTDSFRIFSFVGIDIQPSENFEIESGETQTIRIQANPSEKSRKDFAGWVLFEYRVAGSEPGSYIDKLKVKIVPLNEIVEISPVSVFPDGTQATISLQNMENKSLDGLVLAFKSDFFEHTEALSLAPFEEKIISVPIDKETGSLEAGQYTLLTEIKYMGAVSEKESEINYLEQGGILTKRDSGGFIIVRTDISKENTGNVASIVTIKEEKNLISRLFSTFSPVPTKTERDGFVVGYTWEKEIQPGETLSVRTTTNYTFPFILLIIIIGAIVWVKMQGMTDLVLKKRLQFVRTKGGEFALRVRIKAKARKNLSEIKITDLIPVTTKLYEKMTSPHPSHVDEKTRRLHWNLSSMAAGEERTFTYVIYSKIRIIGSFELPAAHAAYKSGSTQKHVYSNRTSFAAEGT